MKFLQNFHGIFGNFPHNSSEIFTTFCNSYEFHSQNFYILHKNFINNYYICKIYPTISTYQNCQKVYMHMYIGKYGLVVLMNCIITFWCILRKQLPCSYRTPTVRIEIRVWNILEAPNCTQDETGDMHQLSFCRKLNARLIRPLSQTKVYRNSGVLTLM